MQKESRMYEDRIEARHSLEIVEWRLIRKDTVGDNQPGLTLKGLTTKKVHEVFGGEEAPAYDLAQAHWTELSQFTSEPVDVEQDYQLIRVSTPFELVKSSAPDGELGEAVSGLMKLPQAAGQYCLLILCQRLGDFEDNEGSPLFMFGTDSWKQAEPIVLDWVNQIQKGHLFLPKLKIFYMWGFYPEHLMDLLQADGSYLEGDVAAMLMSKIAFTKARTKQA